VTGRSSGASGGERRRRPDALSDDQFDTLAAFGVQNARSRVRQDRLRWRVLHGPSQTVGEQSRELCRLLR
jgi:hypothetical protein